MTRVVAICGSLQASSSNLALLHRVAALVPVGTDYVVWDGLRHLPLFNPDTEALVGFPPPVAEWKALVDAADALLIACPEYVHGMPGSVKNALDWLVGSMEMDGKPVGVTASVSHSGRGRSALDSLAHILGVIGAHVVGDAGIVRGPDETVDLQALIDSLLGGVTVEP